MRARPVRASGDRGKRLDIQGLRAVAVLAVVANHLTGHPRGGFVGVDVFFVISGFLITGLLLKDLGAGDRPARVRTFIGDFYRRRVRRLLPAALLVIVVTVLVARWQFQPTRYEATLHDGGWAAVFWANWHEIQVGTDYFAAYAAPSPLQHYWSLSVEEQFYLAWPLVLLVLDRVARRVAPTHRRAAAASAAVVISAASVLWASHLSVADPTSAYFSTFTRAWELGLGAALACVAPVLRPPAWLADLLGWTGLVLIGVSLFVTSGDHAFPMPGAVLPCVGAALVLAAGIGPVWNPVLTNRVAVFVGDISYSVYLVHYPIIIVLGTHLPSGGWLDAAALLATLGAAVALYELVERPVLDSGWLRPRGRERAARRRVGQVLQVRERLPRKAIGAVGVVGAVAVVALWPGEQAALARRYQAINATPSPAPGRTSAVQQLPPAAAHLQQEIDAALKATSWPALRTTIDDQFAHRYDDFVDRCGNIELLPAAQCTLGPANAPHVLYVIGDSTAKAYAAGLEDLVAHHPGWRLRLAAAGGCEFAQGSWLQHQAVVQAHCEQHKADVIADIRRTRPDVVVVTNDHEPQQRPDGTTVSVPQQEAATFAELARFRDSVRLTVVLETAPGGGQPQTCYQPDGNPVACVRTVPRLWQQAVAEDQRLVRTAPHTVVIDSRYWFCNANDACPAFVGTVPTMIDDTHPSRAFVRTIWPVIDEAFARAGVFTAR